MSKNRKPEEANEIEITDEMVEAGMDAFADYDSRFESRTTAVVSIFEAMFALSPQRKTKPLGYHSSQSNQKKS